MNANSTIHSAEPIENSVTMQRLHADRGQLENSTHEQVNAEIFGFAVDDKNNSHLTETSSYAIFLLSYSESFIECLFIDSTRVGHDIDLQSLQVYLCYTH
jgi:hypothetical protein